MKLPAEKEKKKRSPGPSDGSSTADTPGTGGRSRGALGTHREPAGSAGAGGVPSAEPGGHRGSAGLPGGGGTPAGGGRTRSPGCCRSFPFPKKMRGGSPLFPQRCGGAEGRVERRLGERVAAGGRSGLGLCKKRYFGVKGVERALTIDLSLRKRVCRRAHQSGLAEAAETIPWCQFEWETSLLCSEGGCIF